MRGLKKSKRVSWASDVNLCQNDHHELVTKTIPSVKQVRLFLSEDSPSQVGLVAQDHLQAKASWLLHSTGMSSDDHLPPGFERTQPTNQLKKELSQIPLIKWKCPPRCVLVPDWQVAAGDESKETQVQNHREMRVLEAVYPRMSAIPPSPSVSLDVEDYHQDDLHTPLIPITPIEDEDAGDPSSDPVAPIKTPISLQPTILAQSLLAPGTPHSSQCNIPAAPKHLGNERLSVGMVPGAEPDVVAAASAAFTAIMRSNEQGSLIDPELLIKFLSNPKLIEKLVTDYGIPANQHTTPKPRSPPITLISPQSSPPPIYIGSIESDTPLSAAPGSGPLYPMPNSVVPTLNPRPQPGIVPTSSPSVKAPLMKDMDYYKSLIQQHGGERQETRDKNLPQLGNRQNHHIIGVNQEAGHNSKPRDLKPKILKPCIFFNSPKGCRHGANCTYQHDTTFQQRFGSMPEAQSVKRMKLDREITGRT
ncbi:hypothetical protein HHK36_031246 [Tetracentron sinense]|uniref:C3H1-type domain-containing protein n=1 Tax=Tetracentron sinense TaxID=13715 RepID=A0A834YED1_TETSI|nr:hypothetical protein HHK36_031246 [Tetracentron sinense]